MTRKTTHEEYVQWVKDNRPEYKVLEQYVNADTRILHKHIPSQRFWMCAPYKFKKGRSHPIYPVKRSHQEYVLWIKDNRPEYEVLEKYKNNRTKILHRHISSNIQWKITPHKFMFGQRPTELSGCEIWTEEKYINHIKENNIPIKLIDKFKKLSHSTKHKCLKTDIFFYISPLVIVKNPNYVYKHQITNTVEYKKWLKLYRPNLELIEEYITSSTKINHVHKETGISWFVRPNNVMCGNQHHPCDTYSGFSRKSLEWFKQIEKSQNINIIHKMNGGEYHIEDIGHVDGYCLETNTIYEFHGDLWHGNPEIYDANDINPVTYEKFGNLYQKTIKRDNEIRELGYNLVVIWENEFDNSTHSMI